MSCEVEKLNGIIHISGELTIYSAAALKDGLIAALGGETGECRIDGSEISEIDTAGLQLLLMLRRSCAAAAREFRLLDPSDALREALQLLKLDGSLCPTDPGVRAGAAA